MLNKIDLMMVAVEIIARFFFFCFMLVGFAGGPIVGFLWFGFVVYILRRRNIEFITERTITVVMERSIAHSTVVGLICLLSYWGDNDSLSIAIASFIFTFVVFMVTDLLLCGKNKFIIKK